MQNSNLLLKKKPSGNNYRYVKFNKITATPSTNGYANIAEIQIQLKSVGTNWCRQSGVVATASSTYSTETPSMAIDGVIGTADANRWTSAQVYPTDYNSSSLWFEIDFGVQRPFDSVQISSLVSAGQQVTAFDLLGSNDGTNWTLIKQVRSLNLANLTMVEVLP